MRVKKKLKKRNNSQNRIDDKLVTNFRAIRNTGTNYDGSIEVLFPYNRLQVPSFRFANVSREWAAIARFGIVEVVDQVRIQVFRILFVGGESERHTLGR